jgi:hypothetical protein
MKRMRIMGLCLVAAFAAGAVASTSALAAGPHYGTCVKKGVAGGAGFSDAGCTKPVASAAKYEWVKGGANGVTYTTAIKPATKATLETKKKEKVICSGETSTGTILNETETETTPTFTGCETLKKPCSTAGEPEGTIAVKALQGELGLEKKGTTEITNKIASNLYRQGNRNGEIVEFECVGFVIKVEGTVLFPVTTNKMLTTATVKFAASGGKQKPEKFEGGPAEILQSKFGGGLFEQSGQTITTIQKNAKAIEVSSVN